MKTTGRMAAAAIALIALIALGVLAIRMGRSDTAVYEATLAMGAYVSPRGQPVAGSWNSMWEDLERAEREAPDDPGIQELLGLLEARRMEDPEPLARAAGHFRKALELRPASAYTWANLAEVKYRQGDTGAEFEAALVHAAELGPSEAEVQQSVAFYGLAVLDEVSVPTRHAVERMVQAGLKRNPAEMLQIAERRGRLDIACRYLERTPRNAGGKWSVICPSTEAIS